MARRKKINWTDFISKQQESGKTIEAFSREQRIHPNTFYKNWKKYAASEFVKIKAGDHSSFQEETIISLRGIQIVLKPGFSKTRIAEILKVLCVL